MLVVEFFQIGTFNIEILYVKGEFYEKWQGVTFIPKFPWYITILGMLHKQTNLS